MGMSLGELAMPLVNDTLNCVMKEGDFQFQEVTFLSNSVTYHRVVWSMLYAKWADTFGSGTPDWG